MIVSAGAAGAILLVLLLTSRGTDRRASCRSTLIPAYLVPSAIVEAVAGSARPRLIVVNPESGPGATAHPKYRDAVRTAQRAGARVLGYVPTAYATRAIADVVADIDRYTAWYRVDGIFLDEASRDAPHLAYYAALSRHIRAAGRRLVVVNPGVVPARGYFDVADVVVTFEGPYAAYDAAVARMPDWAREQPPARSGLLIYGASSTQALAAVRKLDGAGYLYVTSGSPPDPWRTLPSYLHEEEEALEACS
jgi:hypothetical protein